MLQTCYKRSHKHINMLTVSNDESQCYFKIVDGLMLYDIHIAFSVFSFGCDTSTSLSTSLWVYCCLFMSSKSPSPLASRSGRWAEIRPLVSSRLFALPHRQNPSFFLQHPVNPFHLTPSISGMCYKLHRNTLSWAFREVKQRELKRDNESELLEETKSSWLLYTSKQSPVVSSVVMNRNKLSMDEKLQSVQRRDNGPKTH